MISRSALALATLFAAASAAHAQTEFTPASGKGRAIVAVSGSLGASAYEPAARKLAGLGYDVLLVDGNAMIGDRGTGLKSAIDKVQHSAHALPGQVGVVGFSLGGGQALGYAPAWSDEVAVVVVMYPLTRIYKDLEATVGRIRVPVLMLVGESDHFKDDCCTVDTARRMAAIAASHQIPLELVSYPGAGHDFIVERSGGYNANAAADAWSRTAARLKQFLPDLP